MTQSIRVLIDSSFLFALNSPKDRHHGSALKVGRLAIRQFIIPDIVLAETAYMLRERIGQQAVISFLDQIQQPGFDLEPIGKSDLARARQIMMAYREADLDLADCCLMALSERLNIHHICTFDLRDFRLFQPNHVQHLLLLPADM
ncbi:MAG: PIN domain-containing protein [Anaerolineae bacterium]|nr:PIN domain-containing protein [Anaerolineae bacterium]